MVTTFAEHARKLIREDMNSLADALANDSVRSFDEYRHVTGSIKGLATAERIILDLVEAAEGGDNE